VLKRRYSIEHIFGFKTETAIGPRYLTQPVEPRSVDAGASSTAKGGEEATNTSSPPTAPTETPKSSTRVINDFFEIRESTRGGLGSFARKELKYGDHILLEEPIIRTVYFDLIREVNKLDEGRKAAFMSLHPYHHDPREHHIGRIWNANAYVPLNCVLDGRGSPTDRDRDDRFCAGGGRSAVLEIGARFNHACEGKYNVKYNYDQRRNIMVFTVIQPVTAGEELTITYGSGPESLYEHYGFRCTCGGCSGLSDEDIQRLAESQWKSS